MTPIQATVKEVRKFGITFSVLTLAIAGFTFYKGSDVWTWFLGGSAFFMMTGLFVYPVLKPIYIGWMTFAYALGWFNTRLLMGISYYLVFTPIGFLLRVFGKDLLNLHLDKEAATYWSKRRSVPFEPKQYERLF